MIPEKYYVFYRNEKEFNIINNHFKKDWIYWEQTIPLSYGYFSDLEEKHNNWVGSSGSSLKALIEKKYSEISFEDFLKYVINKEEDSIEEPKTEDYSYLEPFLKLIE